MKKDITNIISNYFGKIASYKFPKSVQPYVNQAFVKFAGIDLKEFKSVDEYGSINELFTRELVIPRAFSHDLNSLISPTDSFITECGDVKNGYSYQIKGISYKIDELLTNCHVEKLTDGTFINFYLSPKDYHRYHMITNVKVLRTIHVSGKLVPVNMKYLNKTPNLFSQNERVIVECLDEELNEVFYLVLVGALNVGKMVVLFDKRIETNSDVDEIKVYEYEDVRLKKGECFGYFKMGSTVLAFFPKNYITLTINGYQNIKFGDIIANKNMHKEL